MTDVGTPSKSLTPAEALPEIIYGDRLGDAAADISYSEGYFIRELSDAQLASIWGQDTLSWEGFSPTENGCELSGKVIYNGNGVPCIVTLTLAPAEGGQIELELSAVQHAAFTALT